MLRYKACKFFYVTFFLTLINYAVSAQIGGIKVVNENQEKKYTRISTSVYKNDATILKDTTSEFNRYPTTQSNGQYILSFADVYQMEDVLKVSFVSNGQIVDKGRGELLIRQYKKFNRQYSGYISKSGDTILVVCFLDFSNRKKAKKYFGNWEYQNGYLGSGLFLDSRPPNIYCYSFNLRTKELTRYLVP
ncbi:MAG TPA: hypothetical protein VK518_22195 [Puia sp.]|nr:hypothetical protein [Puia sp.]